MRHNSQVVVSAWPLPNADAAAGVLASGQTRRARPHRADAGVPHEAGVLLGLQPQRSYTGRHGRAWLGRRSVVVHGVRVGGCRVRALLGSNTRWGARETGTHGPREHGGGRPRHGSRRCHGCGRVETIHGALVVVGGHHGPEGGLRAQRAGDFGRPVVVAVGGVDVGVSEGGHQAVELCPEAGLEFGGRVHGVHGVPFTFAPLGSSVFEPHLKQATRLVKEVLK